MVAVAGKRIHELPAELAEFLLAIGIPEDILAVLADRAVGVHAVAIDPNYGFRQEAGRESHIGGHLAANQLVQLNLVGSGDDFAVAVVDFELRWRHFRVIFLVLETHGALHFRGGVNKSAQWIAGERMVVTAGIDIFEFAGFVVTALGILAIEKEPFDFVGGIERVAFFLVKPVGVPLQHSADIGGARRASLVNYVG